MHALLISLHSEFYKSRKTLAFWASIILPFLICSLVTLGFFYGSEKILNQHYSPEVLWLVYSGGSLGVMGSLILPFYIIFTAFSVNNIEHKNDTWKSLFAQPLNRFSIYTAKYLFAMLLIAICLFLFATLTYIFGYLLHFFINGYKFNEYNPVGILSMLYTKLFLSSLGVLSLQFIISLIWSDFLKPMGIGFIGVITGIIVATKGWEYAWTIPYSHATLALSVKQRQPGGLEMFTREIYTSLAYALVFFILGYLIVLRKSIK